MSAGKPQSAAEDIAFWQPVMPKTN